MSYLASPLWFLLLVAGMGLALVARYTEPNYFGDGFSLFPAWPVFDRSLRSVCSQSRALCSICRR